MARDFIDESYRVLCELAPWVLLGAILSGLLHVWLPPNFIRRQFREKFGVVKAVLLGVPLPLCSCGVIPVGIGIHKQGASHGAAMGFLISTPQTGVDSVLLTAAMLGWPLAIFKMIVALVTGVLGGWATDAVVEERRSLAILTSDDNVRRSFMSGVQHAVEIIRSIWIWLVMGIIVSAFITVLLPDEIVKSVAGWGTLVGSLLALLISMPMYVCATASIPIAAALVSAGLPPGAALVFLMAGPATNVATISAVASHFGWKATAVYLSTVIVGSLLSAMIFDTFIGWHSTGENHHAHVHTPAWWEVISAILLMLLMLKFAGERIIRRRSSSKRPPTADHGDCCNTTR